MDNVRMNVRELVDLLWRQRPDFCGHFFPKRWQMPPNYPNPEMFLPAFYAQYEVAKRHLASDFHNDVCNKAWVALGYKLPEYGNRVYRVEPDLTRTLMRTSLRGFTVDAVEPPLPAFMVMFPRGMLRTRKDGDALGAGVIVEEGAFVIGVPLESGATYTFSAPWNDEGIREQLAYNSVKYQVLDPNADKFFKEVIEKEEAAKLANGFSTTPDIDSEDLHKIAIFVLNLLAYMSARKDETVEALVPRKRKRGKPNLQRDRDFYTPFVIGETYARGVKVGTSTGPIIPTGRSVCLHWRAGHWRHQRYGKGRQKVRLIHIEPVLVGVK